MKEVTTGQLLNFLVQNEVLHANRTLKVQTDMLFGHRNFGQAVDLLGAHRRRAGRVDLIQELRYDGIQAWRWRKRLGIWVLRSNGAFFE